MNGLSLIDIHAHPQVAVACAAVVAAALALLGLMAVALANRRLRARSERLESGLASLGNTLELAEAEAATAAARLQRLEQAHEKVSERLRFVERRTDGRSFDQAIDSARRGAGSGKIAEQFGLSRGEAELVARMHGRTR